MSKTSLPPGFRFHPTDVELVCYYLKRKVMGRPFRFEAIYELELYKFAPWDLPEKSQLCSKDLEWYFFCPRDRKYSNGSRANRTTDIGYWKTTGQDRSVTHNSRHIGMKKTLIFHLGRAPKGDRTNWVMYEYRLQDDELAETGFSQDAYVLCKIFQKSGPGPKIGEQYGAPFNEEDWEDDAITENFSFPASQKSFNNQGMVYPVCQPSSASVDEVPISPDLPEADRILLAQLINVHDASHPHSENVTAEMSQMSGSVTLHGVGNETSVVNNEGMYFNLTELSVQAGNACYSDTFNCERMLNFVSSELETEHYVELNDLSFLGEDYASEFVTGNHSSPIHPIDCYPISQNLGDFDDLNSFVDNIATTIAGVDDHSCSLLDMAFEPSEIEAFVGSFLNPNTPGFEAQENDTSFLLEELNDSSRK
ncbi:NAC domain-containing protein [Canna indica]|uniref:NAC domain-containing protein n=1 Tax=Canna indica TaxID=4628 RepID=A0AAQ3QMV6_9LILI|nr:NAC domain-containing protein [Canna indica]